MALFSGDAMAVMLRALFPTAIARVEQMESDGTLARVNELAKILTSNGTFEKLTQLAGQIEAHNELLRRIGAQLESVQHERGLIPGPEDSPAISRSSNGASGFGGSNGARVFRGG